MSQTHVHVMAARTETGAGVGIPSGRLGVWWFLASEIIMFGGLIGTYILFRLGSPEWAPAHLSLTIGTVNTFILLTSSMTMVMAFAAVEKGDRRKMHTYLLCTILLGLLFLGIKAFEWSSEIGAGFIPSTGEFWSFYYTMTGLHALHVLAGIVINTILFIAVLGGRRNPHEHRIELAGLYWHFVDIVWIFLFPLLYLA
ncbi:MAG: heme-copper oxidase subunit III [Candidatus Methylomirabilales bacterium]